jgi:DNA-binding MarR family transcriptional regulator
MDAILIEFINSLDALLKQSELHAGQDSGISRLTLSQLRYIEAIHALGRPTLSELAARLNITKASVTPGVNRLAALGFVRKTQSSRDRRVYHVELAPAGERLAAARIQALQEYGEFIRAALDEAEARQFEATLARLARLFKEDPRFGG